ncbi:hypothetical protein DPMN_137098 [Dreissena polymorpha]|uniref:Uncharacterized protein n=1 Tax=Dreissena polymorpha TaxID=45954 RepID=A0A9D4G546_DREPO|nr:hypothetical protein DPMN_137098 [Dreissena polymorpha]
MTERTDERTDEQTNERRNGRTKGWTNEQTDGHTKEGTDILTNGRTDRRTNKGSDGRQTNGRTDGRNNGRANGQRNERTDTRTDEFPIQISTKGDRINVRRRILPPGELKPEVPVPIEPAPLVRFVIAPAPDLALTSSISVPAEPKLPYSTKYYRKRKLKDGQAGEFWRQYNKKLPYRSCN